MCCKLVAVTELQKPACVQCTHCAPGVGCKIYEQRPQGCKDFACLWLLGLAPEEMYPQDTKVVLDRDPNREEIIVHLDPHSNCTAKPAVQRFLHFCLYQKIPLIIVEGDRRRFIGDSKVQSNLSTMSNQ